MSDVVESPERTATLPSGIDLCYQTFGHPHDRPLLLVMGLGGPMTWWDPGLCRRLAQRGFFVIRYDNRDTGRSTHLPGTVSRWTLARAVVGAPVRAPYTMQDLAQDAFSLLDHLGLDSAHVVGVSMGGMIAQTMAIAQPARVRSLTSIMSTTGKRTVGWQHPSLLPVLFGGPRTDRETYIAASARTWQLIGSPGYPPGAEVVRRRAAETFDRGVSTPGVMRQMLAVLTQPNRLPGLRSLTMPALVIHGKADKMVHISGGRSTAAAIPGAELLVPEGMGHDLPPQLYTTFVSAIARTADRAGDGPARTN